jgi:hypothetical protein
MGKIIDSDLRRIDPSYPGMRTIYFYALVFLLLSVTSQNMVTETEGRFGFSVHPM